MNKILIDEATVKLALEALTETYAMTSHAEILKHKAITALREALAEQPAQQCKWPTCQSEGYQQALAEQIKRELVGEQPAQQALDKMADHARELGLDYEPAQQEPEIVQRVKRYAGQTMRTARNPNITARECIELANWIVANTHGIKENT